MIRKAISALVLAVVLGSSLVTPVYADPDTDNIVIKKKESSDNVILLQLRLSDLGYYNYKITGYFGDFTEKSLKDFQKTNNLTADGVAGSKTLEVLYGNTAKRKPVEPRIKPAPPKVVNKKYGELRDWFKYVNSEWSRYSGAKIKVKDFSTGKEFYMIRTGGSNHADVEPATAKDANIIKSFNNGWSWERRAILVYLKGRWIAASMHCMPHAYDKIANNGMTGHVCIHFLNSKTHIHNMRDPDHQRMVMRAAGK